jgi:hypothetical protein
VRAGTRNKNKEQEQRTREFWEQGNKGGKNKRTRDWKLEVGVWSLEFRIANYEFRIANYEL